MYTERQQLLRKLVLKSILDEWLKNRKLPEQVDAPNTLMLRVFNNDCFAFKAVSEVLKVDEKWWLGFLENDMKAELNALIPAFLSYLEKKEVEYSDKKSRLMKQIQKLDDDISNRGYARPDEVVEYETVKKKFVNVVNTLMNIQEVLKYSAWHIESIKQDKKELVIELIS